jgi:putative ABC transport system permease protein
MKLILIAARNLLRNRLRTFLTVMGAAVAILAFVSLRTVLTAWSAAAEASAKDRIGTRHKVSFIMQLPARYVEEIRTVPGVTQVAAANWFGAKDPKKEQEFFGTIAVDAEPFLQVYDEIKIPKDQVEAWKQDRQGAIIGDALANSKGWKIGDKIVLSGTIYPGDWEFHIRGIYTATRATVDRSTLWFHWKYLNESLPPRMQDQVGWIMARIDDPGRAAAVAKTIDAKFDERDIQTLSMSEQALQASFLGMISAVLNAIEIVSYVMMAIMGLILANTIAMGVRERTNEYGVLRAIGFLPKHIVTFILGEGVVLGLLGGLLGLAVGYPFVQGVLGPVLEQNLGAFFPFFRVSPSVAGASLLLAVALGFLAAIVPARSAAKLEVIGALRRVG